MPVGPQLAPGPQPVGSPRYERLKRVVLTDQVTRTLFAEYAAHRKSDRQAEEMGWILLGLRLTDEVVVLASLPAAHDRDAGEAHVWITGPAHLLASRIVRQGDRRVTMLGVVHTHPGRLRHPTQGDLEGDRIWVQKLRGQEGAFGIGTPAGPDAPDSSIAIQPGPNAQVLEGLRFDWYSLGPGDRRYRTTPIELTIGPDLASWLRPVWGVIEEHGERLERLARQMAAVWFDVTTGKEGPALAVTIGLGEPGRAIRLLLEGKSVRYFYEVGNDIFQADLPAGLAPDQGVYVLLSELAART
jgi:hypothetical protein